jgi:putative phage-type endonuclease
MTISAEQKQERTEYIGASDAAAIVGLDPYRTAVDVFMAKTDPSSVEDLDDNINIILGNALEQVIGELAGAELGVNVYRNMITQVHPEWQHIRANLDRTVGRSRPFIPVECKLTNNYLASKEPLPQHIPQILQQMACTGAPYGYLAYLIDGRGRQFKLHRVERDEEAIEGLIDILNEFWFENVLKGIAPEATRATDLAILFARSKNLDAVACDRAMFDSTRELIVVKQQLKGLEKRKDEIEFELKKTIGDHEGISYAKTAFATWKNNKDKVETDWQGVAHDLTNMIKGALQSKDVDHALEEMANINLEGITAIHTTTKPGARVLRLIDKKIDEIGAQLASDQPDLPDAANEAVTTNTEAA